jgi:autotransporter translocation and assembly factor TamB
MSKRWFRWLGGGILAVLLAWSGWRLSIEVPEMLRKAEDGIVAAAARYGLDVRHGGLKLHILHFYLSLDDIEVRDAAPGRLLARAGNVEISLSPIRFLRGDIPVSRVRVRNFRVEAGEWNRGLYDRIASSEGGGTGRLPELLFVDGSVRIHPLGALRGMEADVRELRIHHGRYLGTRIHASVARVSGKIAVPGGGIVAWPFPSVDADMVYKGDVLKVRRLRAWGKASRVRVSGFLEKGKRLLEGEASGEVDLEKWIAAGYPGTLFLRSSVRKGKIEFSASASGPWRNPAAQARVHLRDGDFQGAAVPEADASLSAKGRVVRLDRARAKLMGGTLDAAGSYDVDSSRGGLSAGFSRISLAAVPWAAFGVPFRLSGQASLDVTVSGTPDLLRGSASLSLPGGFERPSGRGREGIKVRNPVSAEASAELSGRKTLRLESVRIRAGRAELLAAGEIVPGARSLDLRGTVRAPAGRAAEYGFRQPVSWKGIAGEWAVSGILDRPRAKVSLAVRELAAWSLPPVPLMLKAEGMPTDAVHFAADMAADSFKATAAGTVTALTDPERSRTTLSVSAREINLEDGNRWVSAVLASLGRDAAEIGEYLRGAKGKAEADGRLGIGPGTIDFQGSARSPRMELRGIALSSVRAEGEYGRTDAGGRWTARGEGKLGDGVVRVAAKGQPGGRAEASAEVSGLRIPHALALLSRGGIGKVEGTVDARAEAREGPKGWEIPRASAEARELSVGSARIAEVRAEGTLGPSAGRFSVTSASPGISLSGWIQRGDGWPADVSLSATGLPTSFLLAAAGRPDPASGGTWSAEAGGVVRLAPLFEGKPIVPGVFPVFHGSVHAEGPAAGAVRFRDLRASGSRQGDTLAGELVTGGPDTRLAWEISLREPFGFRLEGPFSAGEPLNGVPRDDKRRVSIRGRARIAGALRAVERTAGTVRIDEVTYREGGWELSGKDLEAEMDAEGIRLDGGTLAAAGSPVKISGRVSWGGDIDARIDGKLPAGLVRLAVPGVFDRLDGIVTAEVRITGNRSEPVIVGTGRLEGGTLSFLGYAQQFEALKADAVLSREKIVFEHFEGRSGGGYIDGWGEVPLQMDAGQRMYFSVDFFDMRYPYPEDFRPVVQGHVELFGPVDGLMATGEVEVQSARYTKNMYPERALLDFKRRLADVSARREESDFRVRLDIDVMADRTIRIRNNLADASASGEFKVQGDSGKVIILGSFDVYEGDVEFYGNRYELKRVIVDFQDPRRNNPRLDARAETTKGDYTIAVLVSGTLEKPEVDFSSDPPLSQTDIVSLLSFGVTTQTLLTPGTRSSTGTPGTVGGAAIAIGSFAGGVDEKIRGAVGLDKFSIETGFSQTTQTFEPRFVARKSFEDRLSVTMSTSIGTTSETAASGEVRLLENVYLEGGWESATKSAPGQVSGDLKVRFRFQSLKDLLHGED